MSAFSDGKLIRDPLRRKNSDAGISCDSPTPKIWSCDGEEAARIGYKAKEGKLVLDYRFRQYGGDWEPPTEVLRLTHANCNNGNPRPCFRCPGIANGRHCGRRVGKLFCGGRYFLCRHCYGIAYASQSEPRYDRMLQRANKLRMAPGG